MRYFEKSGMPARSLRGLHNSLPPLGRPGNVFQIGPQHDVECPNFQPQHDRELIGTLFRWTRAILDCLECVIQFRPCQSDRAVGRAQGKDFCMERTLCVSKCEKSPICNGANRANRLGPLPSFLTLLEDAQYLMVFLRC
jgi:hypothetical protein